MLHGPLHGFRPRHPLARLLAAAFGVVAALALLAVGLFAFAALAVGGGVLLLVNVMRRARHAPRAPAGAPPAATAGIIEGEFTVVPPAGARDTSSAGA